MASVQTFKRFKLCEYRASEESGTAKIENVLEAISRGETTADNRGQPGKRNGALRFKAACPSVLNFSFCCLVVAFTTHRKILYISISRSTTMEPTDTIWKVCGRTGETK